MDFLSIGVTALLAMGSFVAGWLAATEKTRTEVYTKRLEMYLQLNRLAAELVRLCIENSIDPAKHFGPMVQARLALAQHFMSNAILVSKEVGGLVEKLVEARKEPDLEVVRVTFNFLCQQMAKELKFKQIHSVNDALLQVPQKIKTS